MIKAMDLVMQEEERYSLAPGWIRGENSNQRHE
jgi:hypothetical protein